MIRGLFASASGLLAAQDMQDVVANNLSNLETSGFKRDRVLTESFASMYMNRLEQGGREPVGNLGPGVRAQYTFTDHSTGPVQNTENPFDFAIEGAGFFALDTPEGVRYSRDGAFTLDQAGFLVNQSGFRVLDTQGEHIFADETVNPDRLLVVNFENPQELAKQGNNLFLAPPEAGEPQAGAGLVHAGFLERSNVNAVGEMTRMISAVRLFEAGQTAIQAQDETLEKAVNQVGNTR